ncbi:MAG: ABC transporter permease [Hyphomonadaceae bacterium]
MTADAVEPAPRRRVRARKLKERTTDGSRLGRAISDIWDGLLMVRLWGVLAWSDIRLQYKRSTLGPIWITLSLGLFIGMLGVIYAELFRRELSIYMPHLTVGYIIWNVISTFIENGSRTFINAEGIIKQMFAPLSVHAYRLAWVTLITLAHHAIIFVVIAIIFSIFPTQQWLLAIPGLGLIVLTGIWVSLLLGMLSARFRDIPQILSSITRVVFFVTPVIWQAELVPHRALFLNANPLYHYIEIVRGPLLNKPIDPLHWQVAGAITVLGWIVTIMFYQRFRQRVAYWL